MLGKMAQQNTMMSPELRELYQRDRKYGQGYFSVDANPTQTQAPMPVTQPVGEPEQVSGIVAEDSNPASDLGTLNYNPNSSQNYSASNLPQVSDPDRAFANVTQRQHNFLVREFRPFEQSLIDSVNDTSLIDAVPEEVEEQSRISQEIDERNRSRYGYNRTAVEQQEVAREAQRTKNIGLAGGLNNSRLAQRERNQNLLAQLVNIGQGLNRGSLGQMGSAAEMAINRKNAFTQAKAQSKAQRWGFLGSL